MPWKGVTVSEQRPRFIEDYIQNYYSISDLADLSAKFEETRLTGAVWDCKPASGQEDHHPWRASFRAPEWTGRLAPRAAGRARRKPPAFLRPPSLLGVRYQDGIAGGGTPPPFII